MNGFRPEVVVLDETHGFLCPATLTHTHGVSRCLLRPGHEPAEHVSTCDLCAEYDDEAELAWDAMHEDWTQSDA